MRVFAKVLLNEAPNTVSGPAVEGCGVAQLFANNPTL